MAEASITVAVEATIHKTLRELATSMERDYGVTIESVRFKWRRVERASGGSTASLASTEVVTRSGSSSRE